MAYHQPFDPSQPQQTFLPSQGSIVPAARGSTLLQSSPSPYQTAASIPPPPPPPPPKTALPNPVQWPQPPQYQQYAWPTASAPHAAPQPSYTPAAVPSYDPNMYGSMPASAPQSQAYYSGQGTSSLAPGGLPTGIPHNTPTQNAWPAVGVTQPVGLTPQLQYQAPQEQLPQWPPKPEAITMVEVPRPEHLSYPSPPAPYISPPPVQNLYQPPQQYPAPPAPYISPPPVQNAYQPPPQYGPQPLNYASSVQSYTGGTGNTSSSFDQSPNAQVPARPDIYHEAPPLLPLTRPYHQGYGQTFQPYTQQNSGQVDQIDQSLPNPAVPSGSPQGDLSYTTSYIEQHPGSSQTQPLANPQSHPYVTTFPQPYPGLPISHHNDGGPPQSHTTTPLPNAPSTAGNPAVHAVQVSQVGHGYTTPSAQDDSYHYHQTENSSSTATLEGQRRDGAEPSNTGFGFSSDWEHFGSPNVDEVDDTALFSSTMGAAPEDLSRPLINHLQRHESQASKISAISESSSYRDLNPTSVPACRLDVREAASSPAPTGADSNMLLESKTVPLQQSGGQNAVTQASASEEAAFMGPKATVTEASAQTDDSLRRLSLDAFVQTDISQNYVSSSIQTDGSIDRPVCTEGAIQTDHIAANEVLDAIISLDPWCTEALLRYVAMLRHETSAPSDQIKLDIFTHFVTEESKLRGSKYQASIGYNEVTSGRFYLDRARSPVEEREKEKGISLNASTSLFGLSAPSIVTSGLLVGADIEADGEYSPPGGRPRVSLRPQSEKPAQRPGDLLLRSSHELESAVHELPAPAEMPLARPHPLERDSSPAAAPNSNVPGDLEKKQYSSTNKPSSHEDSGGVMPSSIYKPYSPPSDTSSFPQIRPLNWQRSRNAEMRGRSSTIKKEHEEIFLGDDQSKDVQGHPIRESSPELRVDPKENVPGQASRGRSEPSSNRTPTVREHVHYEVPSGLEAAKEDTVSHVLPFTISSPTMASSLLGTNVVQVGLQDLELSLKEVLPATGATLPPDSPFLKYSRTEMDLLPDDFGFMARITHEWETKAKQIRTRHEKERRLRQEEQEERNNLLFDENEIGYGDISALEDEFKRSEIQKKALEDEAEYDSYIKEVFDPIYNQLQEQIRGLMELNATCRSLLEDMAGGKRSVEMRSEIPDLAQTLGILMAVHEKVELRHTKVFEAVTERDRRYKRNFLQPLYARGEIARMKEMERKFDEAEKKAALAFTGERSDRVKRLMDLVEHSTKKGVPAELDLLETIRKVINEFVDVSTPAYGAKDVERISSELRFARSVAHLMSANSERLLTCFHDAAQLLNQADHDDLVAEARLKQSNPDVLKRLETDRKKESSQLSEESDRRLAEIKKDFLKVDRQLSFLLKKIQGYDQKNGSPADHSSTDLEHQERIKRALEAAKRRNAERVGGLQDENIPNIP